MLEIAKAISLSDDIPQLHMTHVQHDVAEPSSGPMTPVHGWPVQHYVADGGVLRAAPPSRTVTPSDPGEQLLSVADPIVEETFEDCVSE